MREQPGVLEHQADAAAFRRQPDPGIGVGQHLAIDLDPAGIGAKQAGGDGDGGGLAGPGRAEQHGDAAGEGTSNAMSIPSRRKAVAQPDRQAHRPSAAFSRLPNHSESSRPMQREGDGDQGELRGGRLAARNLQRGVDGQRQGLGLAGDVGGEGDDGTELAQAGGVADDAGDQDAGGGERQGDAEQPVQPPGAQRARRLFQAEIGGFQRQANGADHDREGHHAGGQAGAGGGEHQPDAEPVEQQRPDRPADAEHDQQQPAGDHGRQHQRQMDERGQHRPAGEAVAGQHPGGQHGQRQAEADGARGHLQRQPDRLPFFRREGQAIRP